MVSEMTRKVKKERSTLTSLASYTSGEDFHGFGRELKCRFRGIHEVEELLLARKVGWRYFGACAYVFQDERVC
jgi:hypothetical protein